MLSALRTAQRNLPAFKLEMAATGTERELPSDAALTAEMKWRNRADDEQSSSKLLTTVSPANRNGDLGQGTPKVLAPTTEELEAAALEEARAKAAVKEAAAARRARFVPAPVDSPSPTAQSNMPVPLPPKKKPEVAASRALLRRSKRRS